MYRSVKTLSIDSIDSLRAVAGYNILYGAGRTGEEAYEKIVKTGSVNIDALCDDDPNLIGKENSFGKEIISYEQLLESLPHDANINLVITTIYAGMLEDKIRQIESHSKHFELFEGISLRSEDPMVMEIKKDYLLKKESWDEKAEKVKAILHDEESKKVLDAVKKYLNNNDIGDLIKLCSSEEFYFISEAVSAIADNDDILDAGGFIGDLYRQLRDLKIKFNRWYCFECDPTNYKVIINNFKDMPVRKQMIVENLGISKEEGIKYYEPDGNCTRIVDYETPYKINTVAIDDYFKDKKIGYVKMDIEGEEQNALEGGIKTIKRCRPVMAISVYHLLDDFVDIAIYLESQLSDYRFILRNHAWTLGKVLLYCIPNEKM